MEREFYHLDVFTRELFGGNQLAVFVDGTGLETETMQKIAREMNFSESVFIFPPQNELCDFKLRIFTPGAEVPMAGHPTVGTAALLYDLGRVNLSRETTTIHFEENVGVIPVTYEVQPDDMPLIWMEQPLPEFGAVFEERSTIAQMLSIREDDLLPDYPVQVVSTGVPFLYVPVKNMAAIKRIKLRMDMWEEHLQSWEAEDIFMFTPETMHPESTVHSRMFAPTMGISEDPATGAASGPLGSYLLRYGLVEAGREIISEQGFEIGRPSTIYIRIDGTPENISGVFVGGYSVYVGRGILYID